MCKEAKLFASQGGPIILAQIENEYGNIMWAYKDAGIAYVNWCAQMAVAQNIGVPWIMCQQDNAPPPMINTCNGFYCDSFKPNNNKSPKMFTENWTGWFKKWGQKDPHRTAEDLAFSVARFFQSGGVLLNYYMYHGGTNFGRTSGGPFITTSYDYDAPLDEFGNLNQPKWGHLKQLHAAIKVGEELLTNGTAVTKVYGNGIELTTYTNKKTGESFCFLSNNQTEEATVDLQQDGKFVVPAWSVSILGGCKKEIFNTAKVNTQTSIMVKKQMDNEDKASKLSWMWTPETIKDTLKGKGKFIARQLLEQKRATSDVSDYLWYMTSFDINGTSWNNATLAVNSSGQVLHAYVNGKLIGSQSGYIFQFKNPVSLIPGRNNLTLLSVTVGLQNYGEFFDLGPEGINGGPVVLTDNKNATMNLSSNTWNYKVGLNGEVKQLHDPKSPYARLWISSEELPTDRPMTWYKATFKAPSGTDPVVVDLQGMGKGHAWINGNSIGRFWPAQITDSNGCNEECDYRGKYKDNKCLTNCGNPSQRWYHLPRSFLNRNINTLILFEEIGGDPSQVSFQTVTVGSICANANEGNTLEISCQGGQTISQIIFASFGDPQGKCGSFQKGSCEAALSLSAVEKACVGKESCAIDVSDETFGSTNCGNSTKSLAVEAIC
ncbi:hypothetical protein REPUB_Repub03eG0243800 [Reevesia pubescens]